MTRCVSNILFLSFFVFCIIKECSCWTSWSAIHPTRVSMILRRRQRIQRREQPSCKRRIRRSTCTQLDHERPTTNSDTPPQDHPTRTILPTTPEQCDDQLASSIRQQDWDNVLQTLRHMQQFGFVQTEQTFLKCLQAAADTDMSLVVEVWQALRQTVAPTRAHVAYILECGAQDDDPDVLWNLLRESSTTYQWALQILCQRGQWKWALREWKQMQQRRYEVTMATDTTTDPDTYHDTPTSITAETYRALWNVCIHANDCPMDALLSVLHAAESILTPDDILDIVQAFCRSPQRSWRNAMTLWEFLQEHHDDKSKFTLPCYHAVLFHRHLPLATALSLLRHLQRHHLMPTMETYNRVMYLAQRERNVPTVLQLLQELQQTYNLQPNVVTYTHVVRACLMDRQWKRALVVFQVAQDKLPVLDVYLYTAAMEACVALKQSPQALELLQEMQQQGIVPNSFTYRVAMQAAPQRALEFLNALKANTNTSIPLITYNAALQALAQTAKQQAKESPSLAVAINAATTTTGSTPIWQHAVDLLEEIKQQNLQPDGFTYNAVIMCCCHGPWELALQYIQEMQGSSQPPNRLVYTAAIASCGKHGQADHALQLLEQMKQYKIQPDLVTYNAVLRALRVAQKPEQAWQLWKELLGSAQPTTLLLMSRTVAGNLPKRQYSTGKVTLVPDIITISEVIGALAGTDESDEYQAHVDDIVAYAVERKLLLNGFLDSSNEINLSGLTFSVARAACRYLLQHYQHVDGQELTLITGVGSKQSNKTSLRDYLQEWLETEFGLKSSIPRLAQGTLVISGESLLELFR